MTELPADVSTAAPNPEPALYAPNAIDSLRGYIARTWQMRHYAWRVGRTSVRAANAGTSLGALWMFLEPLFSILIYWIIFGALLDVSRGVDNYLAFLTVGQVTFGLSQRALLGASASLTMQAPMLRSLAFPRAVLPLAEVFKALSAYRSEVVVMLVAIVLMGEPPRIGWVLLAPVVAVQTLTSYGVGMALARAVWRIADVQRFVTHMMRLAFYASGVFFPLGNFTDSTTVLRLATINPLYDQVELARWAVLGTRPPEAALVIAMAAAWAVVGLVAGGVLFVRAEHMYSGARTVRGRRG